MVLLLLFFIKTTQKLQNRHPAANLGLDRLQFSQQSASNPRDFLADSDAAFNLQFLN